MRTPRSALLASALLCPALLYSRAALAQSGFVAPDGRARYPGVTIFCPSGTGVAPCSFGGGGGGGGNVAINLGGAAVGSLNRFPVSDSLLEGLINGGALTVGGSVSISGTPSVSLSGALPAGANGLGSVAVSNFPATQAVAGAVSQGGTWSVGVTSLPPLAAGSNAIGGVTVSNFPAAQAVTAASLPLPAGAALDSDVVAPFAPVAPAAAAAS
jgi:hypothetical protein